MKDFTLILLALALVASSLFYAQTHDGRLLLVMSGISTFFGGRFVFIFVIKPIYKLIN